MAMMSRSHTSRRGPRPWAAVTAVLWLFLLNVCLLPLPQPAQAQFKRPPPQPFSPFAFGSGSGAASVHPGDHNRLPIDFGKTSGLRRDVTESSMSKDDVDKIIKGVEAGSRDSLYYFGLLKLYGIVLSRSEKVAAEHVRKAAELGHVEATTAHGVMLMHGTGAYVTTWLLCRNIFISCYVVVQVWIRISPWRRCGCGKGFS
jgi:hypothetical protein